VERIGEVVAISDKRPLPIHLLRLLPGVGVLFVAGEAAGNVLNLLTEVIGLVALDA
jgi:hypothetical protein